MTLQVVLLVTGAVAVPRLSSDHVPCGMHMRCCQYELESKLHKGGYGYIGDDTGLYRNI